MIINWESDGATGVQRFVTDSGRVYIVDPRPRDHSGEPLPGMQVEAYQVEPLPLQRLGVVLVPHGTSIPRWDAALATAT